RRQPVFDVAWSLYTRATTRVLAPVDAPWDFNANTKTSAGALGILSASTVAWSIVGASVVQAGRRCRKWHGWFRRARSPNTQLCPRGRGS
ncbi:hypothetical protein SPRG_21635, partial [Saprolegnia parasitica CBS 223.65]